MRRAVGRAVGVGIVVAAIAALPLEAQDPAETDLLPAGYGSLTQDDLSVRLRTEDLEVRFLPLEERVLRLLAPDSYRSLSAVARSRRPAIDSVAARYGVTRPGLALVSFFGRRPNVRFDPQIFVLTVRNRLLRPIGIVPLSPQFTSQQLDVRTQATGIFLFEQEIPVTEPMTITYGVSSSDEWGRKLSQQDQERQRIASRAAAQPPAARDSTRPNR